MSEEADKIQEVLKSIVSRLVKDSDEHRCPLGGMEEKKFHLARHFVEGGYSIVISNAAALSANFLNTVLMAIEDSDEDFEKQLKIMKKDFEDLMNFCKNINENKGRVKKDKLKEIKYYAEKDE